MRFGSVVLVVLIVVAVVVAALLSRRRVITGKVRARALLTANELDLLTRMEAAAPEIRFHAQVAMGALLEPAFAKKTDPRAYMSVRGTFSQKVVDFVAQDRRTGAVLAVVELDDRTHVAARDARRDAILQEGGYQVIRWQSTAKPDAMAIRQAFFSIGANELVPVNEPPAGGAKSPSMRASGARSAG